MENFIAESAVTKNITGEGYRIYNNTRVENTYMDELSSIGDFSTVRESSLGYRSSIQRHCDIWRLKMGHHTCIGRVSTIQATEIGNFCALSWNLKIGGDNHDYTLPSTHPFFHDMSWGIADDKQYHDWYHEYEYRQPCVIGNDVWIGNGVMINRNVHIGDGCVIGAGAVITRDIEPYSIVVGVPARVVKKRFDDRTIERLLEMKWWNLPIPIIKEHIELFKQPLNEKNLELLEEICKCNK